MTAAVGMAMIAPTIPSRAPPIMKAMNAAAPSPDGQEEKREVDDEHRGAARDVAVKPVPAEDTDALHRGSDAGGEHRGDGHEDQHVAHRPEQRQRDHRRGNDQYLPPEELHLVARVLLPGDEG